MSGNRKHGEESPLAVLTELAVEGTSSLVEAQRALLDLAQQENEIILNGVKERIGFFPGVAMTDLVRRSLETLIGMQHELLTTTSRQTMVWLEAEKAGKGGRAERLVGLAREAVDTFSRAQNNFLEAVAQESSRAMSGKPEHAQATKQELTHLAREAGAAFIEAQKRLLDIMGQQVNVNLNATTRALGMISPEKYMPMASEAGERVRDFVDTERSLIQSFIKPAKKTTARTKARSRRPRRLVKKAVPV